MRILRLTPHYYFESPKWPSRFDPMGGMQVQITNLSNWLAENGVRQDVLTTGFPGIPRLLNMNDHLNVHSVRFMPLPIKSKYSGTLMLDQSWSIGVIKWILSNKSREKFDIVHVHASGVSWPLRVANLASKLCGDIPIVLSIHCSRNFTYEPMNFFDSLIHSKVKKIERNTITNSEKTILLTDKTRVKYEKLMPDYHKFTTISDCIAPYHLEHKSGVHCEESLKSLGIPLNKRIILYVGRIAHEKGWETFVNMADKLRDIEELFFLVCGDGPQRLELESKVRTLKLESRFKVTGFISHKIIPCIMAKSSVLVMPSIHEELGGTSLEGITAGLPVVASCVGGLANILKNGHTAMLVKPEDTQGFADAVKKLLEDDLLRSRLIETSRNEIVSAFEPQNVFPSIIKIYEEILNTPKK